MESTELRPPAASALRGMVFTIFNRSMRHFVRHTIGKWTTPQLVWGVHDWQDTGFSILLVDGPYELRDFRSDRYLDPNPEK